MIPTTTPGDSMMSITIPTLVFFSSLVSSEVTDALADVRLTNGPQELDGVILEKKKTHCSSTYCNGIVMNDVSIFGLFSSKCC